MNVINPATEEIIATLQEDTEHSLHTKLEILKKAQKEWAKRDLAERIHVIQRFDDLLEMEKERLSGVLTSEVGKPLQQSRNEINGARSRIQWMYSNVVKYLSDEQVVKYNDLKEVISYDPLGVVCNISAWNYPYLVGVNVFIPALLAGNSVLYKPSEYASLTGLEIEKLLKRAGLPDGVFQVALGGGETGERLLDMDFDGYYFTGSYRTGQHIYQRVAVKMVPCQLELGGKDPLYVADDVKNIEAVAAGTADGAFYNNGQSCCAVERIYVHEKVYDSYISSFVKEVKSWKIGLPTEEGVYIASLTRKEQLDVLEGQVQDALAKGAVLLSGGKRVAGKGYNFEPTVLTDVSNGMKVMQEESFGPIIGIMRVKDDAEALRLMKDSVYGLTASVYTDSLDRAKGILAQIDSGTGYWNCCDRVSAGLPWSGRKHSGIGATLSHQGLRAFTKTKSWHLRSGQ
ncbi:aldehyde dehydrogenase family protein [Pedobacter cryoconitis]|uniref:Acyl-CoA reductase-like NAD-dependent aldehyde dehydrogenase n=1 Tax=Pedobacter cryoconitis TaxID=188932 RepID=A0A327SRW7_9SPHI|nr:aldehyde dehydrogenase family protein [Pedobacter cryoconitis]RAJ30253.1 acyl-CoA reductase-like NAD-dependent aldehyde dehydrogenase [Pedobacter cryoconitis]